MASADASLASESELREHLARAHDKATTAMRRAAAAEKREAAAVAEFALNDTFKSKMQKSAEACQREGVIFMPMVTESFGGWHKVAVTEVERLGAALARQSGQDEDEAVRHLWGKLAILLQRGNAAILGNRVPDFPAPAIDGRH